MKLYPDATRDYLQDSSASLRSESTRRTYKLYLDLLQREFPRKSVGQFIEADLVAFCNGNGELAPGTVRQRRKIVMQFFEWATWRKLVRVNPAAGLKRLVRPPLKSVRKNRWLTPPEIHALIATTRDGELLGKRDEVLLHLGFLTGLRVHEISQVQWVDLDLDTRSLRLIGKGEKPAVMGIANQLAEPLKLWRETTALAIGREPTTEHVVPPMHSQWLAADSDQLTVNWTSGLGRQGIARVLQRRCEEASVTRCAPHDMRRSYAGLLEAKGVPIQDISKALRHSSIATTQRYLEDNPARVVDFMKGFEL